MRLLAAQTAVSWLLQQVLIRFTDMFCSEPVLWYKMHAVAGAYKSNTLLESQHIC